VLSVFPDLLNSCVSTIFWTAFAFLSRPGQGGTEKKLITKARKYKDAKFWPFFSFVLSAWFVFAIKF